MREIVVRSSDDGRDFTVNMGDSVNVELEETPGTGYSWELGAPASGLQMIESVQLPTTQVGLGTPTLRRVRFVTVGPGTHRLELRLRRPWDSPGVAAQRFSVNIVVQ